MKAQDQDSCRTALWRHMDSRVVRRSSMRGIRSATLVLAGVAALVSNPSSRLDAQQVLLRPQAALYLPTRISFRNGELQVRQRIGVTVGARLIVIFNQRFDLITGVTYIPGYATFRGAGKLLQVSASSHLLTASTGARYWLLEPARKLSWEVHTGVGAAFGGQPAYEDLFDNSTVNGIVGTTLHYQVGQIARLQLRIQERLYRVRFGSGEAGSSGRPFRVSFGLTFPFLNSARAVSS
jgi:hypothetical protein